jgi:myo-inositol catabolism protein IolC
MTTPDWSDLPPVYQERWKQIQADIDQEDRMIVIDDMRMLRQLKRTIIENAVLADREPGGLDQIADMLGRLTERLL